MKKNLRSLSITLIFISNMLLLNACTSNRPPENGDKTTAIPEATLTLSPPIADIGHDYPYPYQDSSTSYPSPEQEIKNRNEQFYTVTPDPNLATVVGTLLYNGEPVSGVSLYLSDVIYSSSGEKWVSFDRWSSNRTSTNDLGNFTFHNIPPGEYGLVLDTIVNSYLLSEPGGDAEIVLTLVAGDYITLGTLDYGDLPISAP